jgi:hypothetical protein
MGFILAEFEQGLNCRASSFKTAAVGERKGPKLIAALQSPCHARNPRSATDEVLLENNEFSVRVRCSFSGDFLGALELCGGHVRVST